MMPTIRLGLLLPVWCCGGLERYHLALAKYTSRAIRWTGCVLTDRAPTLQPQLDELAALMPVYGTMQLADAGLNGMERIVRYATEREALARVLPECDVLLTWGIRNLSILDDFDRPVVLISHGACDWTAGILHVAAERATHYAAVSEAAARSFPIEAQRNVQILPAGIDIDRITPQGDRELCRRLIGVAPEHKLVGYVGRFSPEKNPYQAADIVGQLGAPYVAVMHGAAVVGDADCRREAQRRSKGRVLFCDRSWNTGTVYNALDCLIQASPSEGGPLVALESWSAGVPMVSTDVGVIRDDRTHVKNITTILPAKAPLSDWTAATVEACKPERREQCQTAIPAMRARYGAETMAIRWETWIQNIIRRNGR